MTAIRCYSDGAALALAEYLRGKGHESSVCGCDVHTTARMRVVNKAPTGLVVWP